MKSKCVLIVTFDKYPDYDAGAVRLHMFGKMCLALGYTVQVISMGPSTLFRNRVMDDGIMHISFRGRSDCRVSKASYYLLFAQRLRRHLRKNSYAAIIHTQIDEKSLQVLLKYGKKQQIPVIYDSVEWYSETQFAKGTKARAYKRNDKYNTRLIVPPSSVIAISEYLETHFKNKGVRTVRIPVVMDTESFQINKTSSKDIVTLMYAGSPGKKDCLDSIIRAIGNMEEKEKERIHFVILGCTRESIISGCGVSEEEYENAKVALDLKGRVPRSHVIEEYRKADFSVLLRYSEQRYAKAGFPTKFVESLCCATPVICNISSDLSKYAIDGQNSVILSNISENEIQERIREILSYETADLDYMKTCARKTAVEMFDYHLYTDKLKELMK